MLDIETRQQKCLLFSVNIGFYLPPYELENLFFLYIVYILIKKEARAGIRFDLHRERESLQMSIRSSEP